MSDISSAGIARDCPGLRQDLPQGCSSRRCCPGRAGCRRTGTSSAVSDRLSPARRCPHAEHVFDDGYSGRPRSAAAAPSPLYSIMRGKCPTRNPRSPWQGPVTDHVLTRRGLRPTITSWSRTRRVLAWWRKSGRAARTFRWAGRPSPGLGPVPDPSGSGPSAAGSGPGCGPALQVPGIGASPVGGHGEVLHPEVDADCMAGSAGSGSGSCSSTAKLTYQRPSGSRDTVTVDGVERGRIDMPGHVHTNPSGEAGLASRRSPRDRNPDRVYSADCRPGGT